MEAARHSAAPAEIVPVWSCQGANTSSAPPNPTARPAPRRSDSFRSCRVASAMTTVHSGVVALRMPAVEELTFCSPSAKSRYGTAFAKTAATAICAHTRGERGT
jgi:hypothetical protein